MKNKIVFSLSFLSLLNHLHGMENQLINQQDGHGKTDLHYYILNNRSHKEVKLLLEKKANPNIGDNDGRTPLHHAVMECKTAQKSQEASQQAQKVVKLLLDNNAHISQNDNYGNSPLETASLLGLDKFYRFLEKTYKE